MLRVPARITTGALSHSRCRGSRGTVWVLGHKRLNIQIEDLPCGAWTMRRYAEMSRRVPRGDVGPWRDGEPENGPPWDQGARGQENTRGYAEQPRYDGQGGRYDEQRQPYDG